MFGVGMIDRLPAFKGMEMTFLQVLTSYFDSEDISAVFVEWPQQATIQELRFDSIVNYFATAIEWIDRESTEEEEKCYIRVVRHDFRVVRNDPLCIVETKKDSPRRLSIRVLDGEKGDKSKEELDEGKRVGCPLGLDSSRGSRPTAFEA